MKAKKLLAYSLVFILIFTSFTAFAEGNNDTSAETNINNNNPKSYEELGDISESIVLIKSYDSEGELMTYGSGVAISEDGLIVTNLHVISGYSYFGIVTEDIGQGLEYVTTSILGVSIENDLALLKISVETKPVKLGNTDELKKGQKVVAIGNPFGLESTLTDGIISAVRDFDGTNIIQSTAPISPGSSGGALLNLNGELIGITTSTVIDGQNLNFAVSSQHISQLLMEQSTEINMELNKTYSEFWYEDSFVYLDNYGYFNDKEYIVNFIENNYIDMDFNLFMEDNDFKTKFENFYTSAISTTMNKFEVKKCQANILVGNYMLSFKYDDGKIKDKKWKEIDSSLDKKNQNKILKVNLGGFIYSLDPQLNISGESEKHVVNNMFEGLMRDENNQLKPGIAKSYEVSKDGNTYTFHLRDAKWSDGVKVKASDFEYAWKKVLDPQEYNEDAFQFFSIKGAQEYNSGKGKVEDVGIKVVNDKTLTVTLNKPTPFFIKLTSQPIYMPIRKDIVEKDPLWWSENPLTAVSNGPFKLGYFDDGIKIILVKNENYYNAKNVKLDYIDFNMVRYDNISASAFDSGKLDMTVVWSPKEMKRQSSKNSEVSVLPNLGTWYLSINTTKEPLNDVKVRQALSMALDREELVNQMPYQYEIATGFVSTGIFTSEGKSFREQAGNHNVPTDGANIEEAKRLLTEAGYPDGKGLPEITVLLPSDEINKVLIESIKKAWEVNLGIKIKIEELEYQEAIARQEQGEFMVSFAGWIADYNDPVNFLELMAKDSYFKHIQWESEKYDNLIEKSYFSSGKERDEILVEAEKTIMNEMVVIPLMYRCQYIMTNTKVKGWTRTGLGYWYFGNVEIK